MDILVEFFGNTLGEYKLSNVTTPHWEPEPTRRGTFGILSACIVTLGLCVWTALHLNLPRYDEGTLTVQMRKVGWLIIGLFSPEMIVYTAFIQWLEARRIVKTMNSGTGYSSTKASFWKTAFSWLGRLGKSTPDDIETSSHTLEHTEKWTMTHGFFAVMGGFVIDFQDPNQSTDSTEGMILNFFPARKASWKPRQSLTLTSEGIKVLKKSGNSSLIPMISEKLIKDKSKGSAFAKSFVCLQASWFIGQYIARARQGLPISLLELNTLGHAICTIAIYMLWWSKPLDIEQPDRLYFTPNPRDGRHISQLIAAMCCRSKLDRSTTEADSFSSETLRSFTFYINTHTFFSWQLKSQKVPYMLESWDLKDPESPSRQRDHGYIMDLELKVTLEEGNIMIRLAHLDMGKKLPCESSRQAHAFPQTILSCRDLTKQFDISCDKRNSGGFTGFHSATSTFGFYDCSLQVRSSDIRRWQLALEYENIENIPRNSFTDRVRNLPRFTPDGNFIPLFLGFGIVGGFYGALHGGLSWNAPFSSELQQLVWRLAVLVSGATGLLVFLLFFWKDSPPLWSQPFRRLEPGWVHPIKAVPVILFMIAYPPIRWVDDHWDKWKWVKSSKLGAVLNVFVKTYYGFYVFIMFVIWFFLKIFLDIFITVSCLAYIGARIYLVVYSFYNLCFLPDGAYTLVEWAGYVPHIG
ncbi:hypothetical protein B0T20DRAFT_115879 [Sordaria brevicollis]|uniref:Uncharacterized protein n=1 Tax=Sordaria brevicollis TaxID=83679 RepID=A0AAE0PKH6_SORBR|nr:hypothetical protein B0T20DRAFT_115879 [Sordaria brevicollis]